jgi:branched-chain amino acid transport system ATP-binding protein
MSARLEIDRVSMAFGGLVVAADVSLTLDVGARTALIGPNGAGKTTLVNLIAGKLMPSAGDIRLDGQSIVRSSESVRARSGIVRTFQINRFFADLTVADNVRMALIQRRRLNNVAFRKTARVPALDDEVESLLMMLSLQHRRDTIAQTLAYGEQRLLEIVLALAMRPRVLLLDEPAAGVPQSEVGMVLDVISHLPDDLSILLIEHDMDVVFQFARRIVVLVGGRVFADGTPEEVAGNDGVREIYFGRRAHGRDRR